MNLTALISLVICFLAGNHIAVAEDFEWQTQEHIQGVELATAMDSYGASWVKVSTEVSTHYWSLLNLLRDTENAIDWVDNVKHIALLQRPDYRTDIVHTVLRAPWPFANREMFTISTTSFDIERQTLTISVEQSQEYPGNKKYVTMEKVKGTWQAQQINAQTTRITWSGTGVAGGSIPDWLAISQLQSSTFKTIENLREVITKTKYQEKPLAYQIVEQKLGLTGEER